MTYQHIIKDPTLSQDTNGTLAYGLIVNQHNIILRILYDAQFYGISLDDNFKIVDKEYILSSEFVHYSQITKKIYDTVLILDDKQYVLVNEVVFDKNDPYFRNSWIPGQQYTVMSNARKYFIRLKQEMTLNSRLPQMLAKRRFPGWKNIFNVFVNDPSKDMTDCSISLLTHIDDHIITNIQFDKTVQWPDIKDQESFDFEYQYILKCIDDHVLPNGNTTFQFIVVDPTTHKLANINWNGYIIEPVDGYVPHRRLSVKNGIGSFTGTALGLNVGETMRVKVRTTTHSSLAEASVDVR